MVIVSIAILFTEWSYNKEIDNEYKKYFLETFNEFLRNYKANKLQNNQGIEYDYLESVSVGFRNNSNNFVRVDLLLHQLPQFKLRKKRVKKNSKIEANEDGFEKGACKITKFKLFRH